MQSLFGNVVKVKETFKILYELCMGKFHLM